VLDAAEQGAQIRAVFLAAMKESARDDLRRERPPASGSAQRDGGRACASGASRDSHDQQAAGAAG
jgi:hypothetical protein